MRRTLPALIPAGSTWPQSDLGINLPMFNWVLIENRSNGDLFMALGPVSNDPQVFFRRIPANTVRIFNCGPEKNQHLDGDIWPHELQLLNTGAGAANVLVELADYHLFDSQASDPAIPPATTTVGNFPNMQQVAGTDGQFARVLRTDTTGFVIGSVDEEILVELRMMRHGLELLLGEYGNGMDLTDFISPLTPAVGS